MEELQKIFEPWLKNLVKDAVKEVLEEMLPSASKKYYTREEVCIRFRICKATYHNWIKSGKLTEVKVGGRVYVDADTLDNIQ